MIKYTCEPCIWYGMVTFDIFAKCHIECIDCIAFNLIVVFIYSCMLTEMLFGDDGVYPYSNLIVYIMVELILVLLIGTGWHILLWLPCCISMAVILMDLSTIGGEASLMWEYEWPFLMEQCNFLLFSFFFFNFFQKFFERGRSVSRGGGDNVE